MVKIKPARQVSPSGIALLKRLECKNGEADLKAYRDVRGTWTIGYGHTGPEVVPGLVWTLAQAEAALDIDLDKVEFAICKHVAYTQLNANQFDALALLLYNAGVGVLFAENFSKAIAPDPLSGLIHFNEVAKQFPKWVWVTDAITGKKTVSNGLVNRRATELVLWNTPVSEEAVPLVPVEPLPPVILVADAPVIAPPLVAATLPPVLPRPEAVAPAVPAPAHVSSSVPSAPAASVASTPGGKSFLVTVGGVVAGALTQGYDQVVAVATQVGKVRDGIASTGPWGHVAGTVVCVSIVAIALIAYWLRRREAKKQAG